MKNRRVDIPTLRTFVTLVHIWRVYGCFGNVQQLQYRMFWLCFVVIVVVGYLLIWVLDYYIVLD